MTRVTVDCHMVGQAAAGDAGNGRYAAALASSLAQTASQGDRVAALVATQVGRMQMAGLVDEVSQVPAGDLRRLGRSAGRALGALRCDAAVFTYVAPLASPCPTLLAVHDATFITHPQWLTWRTRRMLQTIVPRAARGARGLLVLSHTARADVAEALDIDPERIHVVSPFAAVDFTPQGRDAAGARIREVFGLERYCLAVGDLGPRKNLVALGEAVRMLGDPTLTLALVGKPGPDGARIARDAGGRWLGHVSDRDLADLYRAATVTAYPSLYEGFGLPAVEAMACGSPVVAGNRGALPEVTDGAAILVEPHPRGIAEGIRAALEPHTAERLRAAGPAQAAKYSAETMGESAWAVLRELSPAPAGAA